MSVQNQYFNKLDFSDLNKNNPESHIPQKLSKNEILRQKIHKETQEIFWNYPKLLNHLNKSSYSNNFLKNLIRHYRVPEHNLCTILELPKIIPGSELAVNSLLMNCSRSILQDLDPLFQWLSKEAKKDKNIGLIDTLVKVLDCTAALNIVQPELFKILVKIPANKVFLWNKIFSNIKFITKITAEEICKIFESQNEGKLYKDLFDSWENNSALRNQFSRLFIKNPELEILFSNWISNSLNAAEIAIKDNDSTLISMIRQLPQTHQKMIWKIITNEGHDQSWLTGVLIFSKEFPYSEVVEKYFDICRYHVATTAGKDNSFNLKNEQDIFHSLSRRHPMLIPQFLIILKQCRNLYADLSLQDIKILESLFPLATFRSLVKNYTVNNCYKSSGDKPFYQSTLNRNIINELRVPVTFANFTKLIDIENSYKIRLFPIFSKILQSLTSELLKEFAFNKKFAIHLSGLGLQPYHLIQLTSQIKNDPSHVVNLVEIAVSHPNAYKLFLAENNLGHPANQSSISRFYSVLLDLHKQGDRNFISQALLTLFENDEQEFVYELLPFIKKNHAFLLKLIDMIKGGAIDEAKLLLRLSEAENKKNKSQNHFVNCLVQIASSHNASLIKAALDLFGRSDHHPLLKIMHNEALKGKVENYTRNLFVIIARGQEVLAKNLFEIASKPQSTHSSSEKKTFMMLQEGYLNLAIESTLKENAFFWNSIDSISDFELIQQLHHLYDELKSDIIPQTTKELLWSFVLQLASLPGRSKQAKEWISNLEFLLSDEPGVILSMLSSEAWKSALKGSPWKNNAGALVDQVLKQFPLKVDSAYLVYLPASLSDNLLDLTLTIAHCLLTPKGSINPPQIDNVIESAALASLKLGYEKSHLKRVLEIIKHPNFNDRLSTLTAPPKNSKQAQLVQSILDHSENSAISPRDAKLAVLSALLWPLRQGEQGSCFATSAIIQLDSSAEGLKQSLEDYISILSHGYLERKREKFPIYFEKSIFEKKFKGVNFLVRAREYAVASMGASVCSIEGMALKNFNNFIVKNLNEFKIKNFSVKDFADFERIEKLILEKLQKNFASSSQIRYYGHEHHAEQNLNGAWKLVDIENEMPIAQSLNEFISFFKKVFEKSFKELHNNPENIKIIQMLSAHFANLVVTEKFILGMLDELNKQGFKNIGLPAVNPIRYFDMLANSPFSCYQGGDIQKVLETYHERKALRINFSNEEHPLLSFERYKSMLSEAENSEARDNSYALHPLVTYTHAFSIKAANVVDADLKSLADLQQKQNILMKNKVLSPLMQSIIINLFTKTLKVQQQPYFKTFIKQLNIKECTLKAFNDIICDASRLISCEPVVGSMKDKHFSNIIRLLPFFDHIRPKVHVIGDTNWKRNLYIGFGLSLDHEEQKPLIHNDSIEGHQITWSPEPNYSWHSYKIQSVADPILRIYAKMNFGL